MKREELFVSYASVYSKPVGCGAQPLSRLLVSEGVGRKLCFWSTGAPERFIWIIFIDLILLLYSVILAAIAFEYPGQNKLKISMLLAASLLVTTGVISLKEQIRWPFVASAVLVASLNR